MPNCKSETLVQLAICNKFGGTMMRLTWSDCRAELVVLMEPHLDAEEDEELDSLSDAKNGVYEDNRELR